MKCQRSKGGEREEDECSRPCRFRFGSLTESVVLRLRAIINQHPSRPDLRPLGPRVNRDLRTCYTFRTRVQRSAPVAVAWRGRTVLLSPPLFACLLLPAAMGKAVGKHGVATRMTWAAARPYSTPAAPVCSYLPTLQAPAGPALGGINIHLFLLSLSHTHRRRQEQVHPTKATQPQAACCSPAVRTAQHKGECKATSGGQPVNR